MSSAHTTPEFIAAVGAQNLAADPSATRLASANAGSGKTRVLVNRVSRILLNGVPPENILCLTYTKAAAAEMQTRLFGILGDWSILPEAELKDKLDELLGADRPEIELGAARQLFAKALETPEGLKVQTLHAFCERILSRFPLEAGILPGFEPLEDADTRRIVTGIWQGLMARAAAEPSGEYAAALQTLSAQMADATLDGVVNWAIQNGPKVLAWGEAGGAGPLAARLGLKPDADPNQILQEAWHDAPKEKLSRVAEDLSHSPSVTDKKNAGVIAAAIKQSNALEAFDAYSAVFLTQKGELRKSFATKKASDFAVEVLAQESERIYAACQNALAARSLKMTQAIFTLAQDVTREYRREKRRLRKLDFSDQILWVRDLLMRSEVAQWVKYKLDGGITHILVDEAQDTSPEQWDIVDALVSAFSEIDPHDRAYSGVPIVKTFFAVGDEKQSIYSFQGARPEVFIEKIRDYTDDGVSQEIRMRMSFRSAPEVLRVVDGVFVDGHGLQRMFDADTYAPASDDVRHTAHRQDRGRVDLWPLSPAPEAGDDEVPWDIPVDRLSQGSSREQLAVKIAQQIAEWLDTGEPIFDRDLEIVRPMKAADILILVRSRGQAGGFFDAVIRNLKANGVPVSGADRLRLKEALVVKDLLSLSKFVLLPSDDLSLAEVLRSPMIDLSEDDLFDIAHGRDGTVWEALGRAKTDAARQAHTFLSACLTYAKDYAPYEFYARVLQSLTPDGDSVTRKIRRRLGVEAKDVTEAFLARALAHQRRGAPSLQHFVQEFENDDQVIKRDLDGAQNEVRVMTVHGAKGLEAPVVFLPDTTQVPMLKRANPLPVGEGFAYLPSDAVTPDALQVFVDHAQALDYQEAMRLLYVAMTRAESRLVVCGYQSGKAKAGEVPKGKDGSWYEDIGAAMRALDTDTVTTPFGDGLSYGGPPADMTGDVHSVDASDNIAVPDWARVALGRPKPAPKTVSPSHLLAPPPGYEAARRSPLDSDTPDRFLRGNLIHKLLEILPEMNPDARSSAADRYLGGFKTVGPDLKQDVRTSVFAVLDAPEFQDIFAHGSMAEISLAGTAKTLPEGLYLNGQIDRLVVSETQVLIIDYKSNRPPPTQATDVPDLYVGQMAAYRALAQEIYPEHTVKCGLLWTDTPILMWLSDDQLDAALTMIATLPTYRLDI